MDIHINNEEWLKELTDLGVFEGGKSDEGLTAQEWADTWGVCIAKARAILKEGKRRKLVRHGKRKDIAINDRPVWLDVYRFIKR